MAPRTRLKPTGFSTGEILTSAQATSLDTRSAYCVATDGDSELRQSCTLDLAGFDLDLEDGTLRVSTGATIEVAPGGAIDVDEGNQLTLTGTTYPVVGSSHTITNYCPRVTVWDDAAPLTVNLGYWQSTSPDWSGEPKRFEISLPAGVTITSATIRIQGSTSGTLPADMPTLTLFRVEADDGDWSSPTQIGAETTDPSASNAAYTVEHPITITGLSEAIVSTRRYYLRLRPQEGGGAAANWFIFQPYVSLTVTALRQA